MASNLCVSNKSWPICRRAQHTARVAFGLAAVGLCRPVPVDPSQGVAAAGFDYRVAVPPGVEARPQSDMKRDGGGQGFRGVLGQTSINEDGNVQVSKDGRIRIDQDRDLARIQRSPNLPSLNQSAGYPFDRDLPGINRLRKRNRPADGQRLRQLADEHLQPGALQTQGHTGGQVAPTTDEN